MIFGVGRLIEHVTSLTEMQPGDMLLTGSPDWQVTARSGIDSWGRAI